MKFRKLLVCFVFVGIGVAALFAFRPNSAKAQTNRVPDLPETVYDYTPTNLPNYFNSQAIRNADTQAPLNPVTDAGATLGRVLFYDLTLSANDSISCASCHLQANGFADPNSFSTGFDGGLTNRNSMGLVNARYYQPGSYFWDQRAETLEDQVLMPIQDHIEMGLTLSEMETKLSNLTYYAPLFEDAFGSSDVTSVTVSMALSQFVRSIISYESKFDQGLTNNFADFTDSEDRGRALFNGDARCSRCHETDMQIADQAHNTGLDAVTIDAGVGGVTGNGNDDAAFKVSSLRNVELTAPYMHDGRFDTLLEVVQFYNSGVQNHPNLSNQLQRRNQPVRLNLDAADQQALVDFMETLTDDSFTSDLRFSDPFVDEQSAPTAIAVSATEAVSASSLSWIGFAVFLTGLTLSLPFHRRID